MSVYGAVAADSNDVDGKREMMSTTRWRRSTNSRNRSKLGTELRSDWDSIKTRTEVYIVQQSRCMLPVKQSKLRRRRHRRRHPLFVHLVFHGERCRVVVDDWSSMQYPHKHSYLDNEGTRGRVPLVRSLLYSP